MDNLRSAVEAYAIDEANECKRAMKRQFYFWCERSRIPKNSRPVEAFESEKEIVIMFGHEDIPEAHNCDEMGCGSMGHVRVRINK